MKKVVFIFSLVILLGLSLMYLILRENKTPGCGVQDTPPICGNISLDKSTSKGRQIFYANCAACHQLNKNMSGPALKDLSKKYDSLTIINFLRGRKTKIKKKGYQMDCLIFRTLSDDDILAIIKYTNN